MNVVAQVFAGFAALVHVLAFVWETLVFRRPGVHRRDTYASVVPQLGPRSMATSQ